MIGHRRTLRTGATAIATALVAGLLSLSAPFVANAAPTQAPSVMNVQAVAAEDPTGCSYATGSLGKYAESICWIDFSQYDEATARSTAGQPFTVSIGGGFTASFQVKTRSVAGWPFPASSAIAAADFGVGTAWSGPYYGTTAGKPILYNIGGWGEAGVPNESGVTWTLDNIEVTGPDGLVVDDFKFVSGDAEATHAGEYVGFRSDVNLELLEELRSANGGCLIENTTGIGTNSVVCTGQTPNPTPAQNSNLLFASQSPTFIEQNIRSSSRNAGVFGFMMSKVNLTKVVDGRANSTDSFGLSIKNGDSAVGSATTGLDAGASTGPQTVLAGSTITLSEAAEGSTNLNDYDASWSCLRNGVVDPGLIANADGNELEIAGQTGATGDFIDCTVTNTAKPRDLKLAKASDATTDSRPGDIVTYTVTATNTGEVDFNAENPAVVFDDLSGVLDDADFNDDAVADRPGSISYLSPLLGWTGALPAGESVSLSYTVALKAGGDGTIRNVAWEPLDPEVPVTPACDPADADGNDPVTGEACAVTETLLPKLTVLKTADTTELPAVGETVTYTITVTNVGPGAYTDDARATLTDDLSEVLDDATFDDGSLSASVGDVARDGMELSWSGPLASGESATISYTVTYTGEGNHVLRNLACIPASEVVAGGSDCSIVAIPGASLEQWKTVEADSDPVAAGTQLSYTLHFQNTGQTAAEVNAVDDLSLVTDDADVSVEPSSTNLTAVRNGDKISVTGSVPMGETRTVTYTVTVKADDARGDDVATNFLLAPGELPPPTGVCVPTEEQLPDCTTSPIGKLVASKSVTADSDPVVAGTTLSYTLTFENQGKADVLVDERDVLADVLDDATIKDAPTSSDDALTVSDVENGEFTISGTLGAGETVTVNYTVTVNEESMRGNNFAANFLVTGDELPPVDCEVGEVKCTETPLPNVSSSKSVDPESGSTVVAGQLVTYTLTFTNTGEAAGPVDHIDYLRYLLDDATITSAPVSSDAALEVSEIDSDTYGITGTLQPGQTVTVSYQATVNPDGERGDNILGNVLAKESTPPPITVDPVCETGDPNCTVNPVPYLVDYKSVSPSSTTPVVAGQELTYTLTFENRGAAAGTVDRVDDLTHVLDDAELVTEPAASDEALSVSRDGARISVNGSLAAGQQVTVSYTVRVKATVDRGDDILANFLIEPTEEPPVEPICEAAEGEDADCTINPVGNIQPSKSVDPKSGTTVKDGETLNYTLSFTNTGEGAAVVDYTDYLAGVLDDASWVGNLVASDGLTVARPTENTLLVTGTVQRGETSTVSYQVKVKPYASQGDHKLGNFLTETGEEPPAKCVAENPLCTENPTEPPVPGLASTGMEAAGLLLGALLLVGLGGGALVIGRRRKRATLVTDGAEEVFGSAV